MLLAAFFDAPGNGGEGLLLDRAAEIPWVVTAEGAIVQSTSLLPDLRFNNLVWNNVEPGELSVTVLAPDNGRCALLYPQHRYRIEAGVVTVIEVVCRPR